MRPPKSVLLLFALEIAAVSLFFWHQTISHFIGWGKDRLALHISTLGIFLLLFALLLIGLLQRVSRRIGRSAPVPFSDIFRYLILSLSPLLLLSLVFLPYFVFLKDIRGFLLPVSLAGTTYLMVTFTSRLRRTSLQKGNTAKLPPRLALMLFGLSLAVYIVLASGLIFPPQPFTGDEPHYLLVTKSLIQDGDINLANNYADQDYLDFYPGMLRLHAYPGKKGGDYLYSKHFPALPMLLVPTYMIAEKMIGLSAEKAEDTRFTRPLIIFFSRLPICILTALLGMIFFHLVFDITQKKALAGAAWALFSFTTPMIFYSQLIYPEIPVALIVCFVIRDLVIKKEKRPWRFFLIGAGIALLPWFGIKYIVLSAILSGILAGNLLTFKKIPKNGKRTVFAFIPMAVSAFSYLFFYWSLYGSFSPVPAYRGIAMDQGAQAGISSILRTDFADFLKRAAGYFLDQRVGIFVYAPVFILGIAGFSFFFKKKRKESSLLLGIFLAYGMFSAYYYWGGYCPPGRPLIPVIWILALFLAVSLAENRTRLRAAVIHTSAALSFFVVWVGLKFPWILYNEDVSSDYAGKAIGSNFFRFISNTFIDFQRWIPSFVRAEKLDPVPLILWIVLIILVVSAYIVRDKKQESTNGSFKIGIQTVVVLLVSLMMLTYIFFHIHLEKKEAFDRQGYALYFQDENNFGKELDGFWTRGERQTRVILATDRPTASIRIALSGPVEGTTSVQVGPKKKKITRRKRNGFEGNLAFPEPVGFRLGKEYLYTITIRNSSGFYPFRLDRTVRDNRYLGVFVKITS